MKLRNFRVLARMSQKQMAKRLGITELSVIKYESGASIPGREIMLKIYKESDGAVTPNDFFELDSVAVKYKKDVAMNSEKETIVAAGLMSGTSMDGIDAALLCTDGEGFVKSLGSYSMRYEPQFQTLLKSAEQAVRNSDGNLKKAAASYEATLKSNNEKSISDLSLYLYGDKTKTPLLDDVIKHSTTLHIKAVKNLLKESNYKAKSVDVVGYHGQTLFHKPSAKITIQAGDGQELSDKTEITTVYDFRANDVANGGQGAPFAPLYHQTLAKQMGLSPLVVANCGGIANITVITGKDEDLYAFDTGPGNALVDRFVKERVGRLCDEDGIYGSQGSVNNKVLNALLEKAVIVDGKNYLELEPPKSLDWNDFVMIPELKDLSLQDGCRTLEAFTARCIVNSLKFLEKRNISIPKLWVVAGGGWKNPVILEELRSGLTEKYGADIRVSHADDIGWSSTALEAEIFAYLAVRSLKGLPLSIPGTTRVPKPLPGGVIAHPQKNLRNASVKVREIIS